VPSKPHDGQMSIVLALFASPNLCSPSSIRSLHHLGQPRAQLASVHIEKHIHIFCHIGCLYKCLYFVFTNFVIEELKYLTFLSPSLEHFKKFHLMIFLDYLMTKLTVG